MNTSPDTQGYRTPVDWQRLRSTAMIWLTASMVTVSLFAVVGFLGFLLWFGGQWLIEPSADTLDAGLVERLSGNLGRLLFGATGSDRHTPMLPAIVGTAVMILLMTVVVAPLGVIVAIWLHEYARDSWYTDVVRISIQNLAGVPSIVFGVFGLGFFVYVVGGRVDEWLFADALPSPTVGTPGLLWAALTLAMLTLPIVIVSTEEGLARLPRSMREGSMALGATRSETVFRILLPAAAPSVFTGVILAIARAAGEVAPLMLVGVIKFAPTLPINLQAPFIHLEQKFMHLGFFIYDVTLHSTSTSGRLGLICAASLALVSVVLLLNLTAIILRKRLRDRYQHYSGF